MTASPLKKMLPKKALFPCTVGAADPLSECLNAPPLYSLARSHAQSRSTTFVDSTSHVLSQIALSNKLQLVDGKHSTKLDEETAYVRSCLQRITAGVDSGRRSGTTANRG